MGYGFSPSVVWPALDAASPKYIPVKQNGKLTWYPKNDSRFQTALIICREEIEKVMATIDPDELSAIAAPTAEEINDFLAKKKVDLRLEDWDDPDTIGYQYESGGCENAYVLTNDKDKPTIKVAQVGGEVAVTAQLADNYELMMVTAKYGSSLKGMELYLHMMALPGLAKPLTQYHGSMFPSLLFESMKPDFSPLIGMYTRDAKGGTWRITQAMEEVKFAMGPQGVSAMAAFAYADLAEAGDVVLAFCWSHVRRQFYDIQAKTPANGIYVFDSPGKWMLKKTGYIAPLIVGSFERDEYASRDVDVTKLNW